MLTSEAVLAEIWFLLQHHPTAWAKVAKRIVYRHSGRRVVPVLMPEARSVKRDLWNRATKRTNTEQP